MRNELENLIGRFQSALLAANTIKVASVDTSQLPTVKVASTRQLTAGNRFLDSAVRAVDQAKTGLQTFLKLVNGQDYTQARQVWLQARRLLWDNYPTENQSAQPEVRAMWLDRGTIVNAKSEQDLGRIFDQMAASGINTVFFETVNAGYTIYPSNVAPEQNPMTRGWDPLAAAVKLAHERGMELHAWVWVFATGNQRHNILLNKPEEYPGPVIAAHPDWAIIDNQRRLFHNPSGKVFLDPTNPEARSYLLDLMDEIVSRYQVDGIQLDYIRYPFQDPGANQNHGYGRASREAFKQLAGVDPMRISPSDRALWQKWTDFRVQQVDSFVAAASQRLRAKRPELIISAAVFPLPREERLQRLQQNWEEWAQRGDVDLMVPMTYALETNQLQQIAQPLLSGAGLNATLVLPGIRLLNLPDAVAIDQIQLLRDLPAGGYSLFAFENLNQGLQTIFRRARNAGSQTSSDVLPYRQPFRAAASRYAALQREWNFMLANNQIQIPEPVLSQWRKQIDELAGTFNQLADQPTSDRLLTAREQLTAFRSQFRQLMQLQAVEQPYQVQAWENRLSTLERLLGYGERVVLNRRNGSVAEQR